MATLSRLLPPGQVGVPVPIEVGEQEELRRVAADVPVALRPRAIAAVAIHVNPGAATERADTYVEVAVRVDVGEVDREQPVGLAVHRQAVVPRQPGEPTAVAQRRLQELIAEVVAGVVVVHAIGDVDQAVAVQVAERHSAVAERAVRDRRPASRAVPEPDRDPVHRAADVRRAVVADRDDVRMPVGVHVAELELRVAAVPGGVREPRRVERVGERRRGRLERVRARRRGLLAELGTDSNQR
jgi:hypothetical protein